jgi:ATP-dependent protease Clp ATPase subunit
MLITDTFSLQVLSVAVYNHYKRIYNANVQKELVSVL